MMFGQGRLEGLRVGEEVCFVRMAGPFIRKIYRGKVERLTATQCTALTRRWNLRTGAQIGVPGGYTSHRLYLQRWTPELQANADRDASLQHMAVELGELGDFLRNELRRMHPEMGEDNPHLVAARKLLRNLPREVLEVYSAYREKRKMPAFSPEPITEGTAE